MAPMKNIDYGKQYEKWDLDRCGLFAELGYISNKRRTAKGRREQKVQFTLGVKNCNTTGYFDSEFKSLYYKDKFVDKWRQNLIKKGQLKWNYTSDTKKHATPGDCFGTFTDNMEAFSPLCVKKKPMEKLPKNFLTNPGKKGGPGYADITLSKFPKYDLGKKRKIVEVKEKEAPGKIMFLTFPPRDYFDTGNVFMPFKSRKPPADLFPGKIFLPPSAPGFINKFPEYKAMKSRKERMGEMEKKYKDKIIRPWGNNKSFYTVSIINNKIKTACNVLNYRYMKPITYPLD